MRSKLQSNLAGFLALALVLPLASPAHSEFNLSSFVSFFKSKGKDLKDWDKEDREVGEKDADHDDPAEQKREALRRILPPGKRKVPLEKLIWAQKNMRQMRRYRLGAHELLAPLPGTRTGNEGSEYLVPEDAPSASTAMRTSKSLAPISSACNWQSLGPGNIGGRTRAIVVNPQNTNILYAGGATGGVFKTLDNQTWTSTGLMMDLGIGCLTMDPTDPNTIYCGTGEDVRGIGIFKTSDGGNTWNLLPTTNAPDFYYVRHIAVSPHNHLRLYAATDQGVYISNDGGNTWGQIYSGNCEDIRIRPDTVNDYALLSVGDWNGTLYINTAAEAGGTWKQVLSDEGTTGATMGLLSIDIAPSAPQTMYAMSADSAHGWNLHGFYRSVDGGNTWTMTVDNRTNVNDSMNKWLISYASDMCGNPANTGGGQGWYDNVIAVDPTNPNRVWADGIDVFRSDDGGNNWGLAGDWTRDLHADQHAITFDPHFNGTSNTTMYFGNDGGVFRCDNPLDAPTTNFCSYSTSVQFHFLDSGWLTTEFYDGTSYPGGATYFGGSQDNGTSRGTDATGVNGWKSIGGGDGAYVAVDPTNTNILFEYFPIQKSTDGGNNWTQAMTGITDPNSHKVFIMDPENPQDMWTGGSMMWLSTNEGNSWTQASVTLNGTVSAIAASPKSSGTVMAGDDQGYIYYNNAALSATSTTTWASTRPVSGGYVSWIGFDTLNANTAFAVYSNYDVTHVWKTTNGGASWTASDGSGTTGIPDVPCRTVLVDPQNSNRVFVGTDFGIFVSLDGGSTWAVCTDFPAVATYSFNVDASTYTLFAFTRGRGAYKICLTSGAATPTATISATPLAGVGSGLCGQYFSNTNLTGSPCGTRLDPYVNYMLPTNGITVPGCGALVTNFSVKWTGYVQAEYNETYTFYTTSDDGARFIIINPSTGLPVTLINQWVTEGPTEYSGTVPFAFVAGQKYQIEMDYFQGGGGAMASLSWQSPETPKEIIPTRQLFPGASCSVPTSSPTPTATYTPTPGVTPPLGSGSGLCAQYFTNTNLTGSACVTQLVPYVDWDLIVPPASGAGLSIGGACGTLSTNFSIKYTGFVQAQFTENYTFYASMDDGVRLIINTGSGPTTVINQWITEGPTVYSSGAIALTAGQQYAIEVDYFQGGGGAQAELMWESPHTPMGIIPTNQLYPSALCATSPTPTFTFTRTNTPTATYTPTRTFTSTSTATNSFTPTYTSSFTATPTATPTRTFSPTFTSTNTSTVTITSTSSFTNSPTKTATATSSSTSTASNTSTTTATNSFSATSTSSSTSTSTASMTSTASATWTSTSTLTPTVTNSVTVTPSSTFTATLSSTSTSTSTATYSNTFTVTSTGTSTRTSTPTSSSTSTATPSFTSTRTSTATPSSTFTQTSTNTGTSTATLTASKTWTSTLTSTATATASFTATPTMTFSPTSTVTRTFTATLTLTRTLTATTTSTSGSSTCSGVPAWNGNFVYYAIGAKVTYNGELYQCIQAHTSESNWMPPVVPALWQDLGPCAPTKTAVVFPNPYTGAGPVQLTVPLTSSSDVGVKVYTTNFRRMIEKNFPQSAVGTDLTLDLKGDRGEVLANGLYYILVEAQGHRWVVKLLVLR